MKLNLNLNLNLITAFCSGILLISIYDRLQTAKLQTAQLQTNVQIAQAFSAAIEYKDEYTMGHSLRVANYARTIAKHMGLPRKFVERVYIAALLHDIGKIAVPDTVLQKPGKLDEYEFNQVKRHVEFGVSILQEIESFQEIVPMIADHHEFWDGLGYPAGKRGSAISLGGRILAVADTYDAMTSQRIYRDLVSREEACQELHSCSGSQFDPEIVEIFAKWHCK